jgi:transposase-like protein
METYNVLTLAERIPDEDAAYRFMESLRWADKPVCPHCGSINDHYFLNPQGEGRKTRTGKVSARRVWKCREPECRKQFSVLTGTIFHGTKIPVRTWVFVVFEMCASKNGVAARELERRYGLSPKSAWFMTHRIREAMKREPMVGMFNGIVEADETYIGGKATNKHNGVPRGGRRGVLRDEFDTAPVTNRAYTDTKIPVVTLVDRETGEARSQVMKRVTGENIRTVLMSNMNTNTAVLMTDQAHVYTKVGREMPSHHSVNHSEGEYVRGHAHTNTVEGFFSQLKRSIDGTHHHVTERHLDRYLAEFDYRYSTRKMNDTERTQRLLGQVAGRRLTYRRPTDRAS